MQGFTGVVYISAGTYKYIPRSDLSVYTVLTQKRTLYV